MKWLINKRFLRFGTVGASGMVVNLAVLYFFQEKFFADFHPVEMRLNLSLAGAIFVATVNNFLWNRAWTWGDRREGVKKPFILQLFQYFAACWVAILLQFVFTRAFALAMHYIPANVISVALGAVINYKINDMWTFATHRILSRKKMNLNPLPATRNQEALQPLPRLLRR